MNSPYNASVWQKLLLSDKLMILRVKPDFPIKEFQAGQYTLLGLNLVISLEKTQKEKLVRKAYSIASSPYQTEYLEFYISLVEKGELTPALFELKEGDRLFLGPKTVGHFTMEKNPPQKHLLFISTGTGLAPFISMIRTHLICKDQRKFVVLHGARYSYELGYYQELSLLHQNCPNLVYLPTLTGTDEKNPWGGLKGRVTTHLDENFFEEKTGLPLRPEHFDVYLCGNPKMVEEASTDLVQKGFKMYKRGEGGEIFIEKYW